LAAPTLIYCGGGNRRFAEIAIAAGFKYGSRLPNTVYAPLYFADQDWKNPNRRAYMKALEFNRPEIAGILDWERLDQLPDVLDWAEEAAQFVNEVMIIPKVQNGVIFLPRFIGGKPVRLGYSVPTKYGGTELMVSEFFGWPVHLLGGSPHVQIKLAHYLDVVSTDGNMAMKMATRFCAFYESNSRRYKRGHWPMLQDADGRRWDEGDGPYEAFRRSCENIMNAWKAYR